MEHLHCGRNQIENSRFDPQKPRMAEGYSVLHSSDKNRQSQQNVQSHHLGSLGAALLIRQPE